jgi:hypothetical protein
MKLNLPKVTLAAYTSVRIEQTIKALEYSYKDIDFGDVVFISDIQPENLPSNIRYSKSPRSSNIEEWNYNIIYDLPNHIDTEFVILIHDNGFIVNPSLWRDEFLEYDYIGAPWPLPNDSFSYRDINNEIIRVGNSVSLRSKKLLDVPIVKNLEWKPFHGYTNEDGFVCVNYRHEYIESGCKFANIDVAKYFSHETEIPEIQGIEPFAFHNYNGKNIKYPKF